MSPKKWSHLLSCAPNQYGFAESLSANPVPYSFSVVTDDEWLALCQIPVWDGERWREAEFGHVTVVCGVRMLLGWRLGAAANVASYSHTTEISCGEEWRWLATPKAHRPLRPDSGVPDGGDLRCCSKTAQATHHHVSEVRSPRQASSLSSRRLDQYCGHGGLQARIEGLGVATRYRNSS